MLTPRSINKPWVLWESGAVSLVAIAKTLLLKARRMREEGRDLTRVTVVTRDRDEALEIRYKRLFRTATLFEEGFEAYIARDLA